MAILLLTVLVVAGHSLTTISPINSPSKTILPAETTIITIQGNTLSGETNRAIIWGEKAEIWDACYRAEIKYPDVSFNLCWNLAQFECGLRHKNCYGDSGLAYGMHQWWQSSWNLYNKKFGTNLDRKNAFDQAEMSARVITVGDTFNWKRFFKTYIMTLGDKL